MKTSMYHYGLALVMAAMITSGCGESRKSESSPAPATVSQNTAVTPSQVTAAPSSAPAGSIAVASQPLTAAAPAQTGATRPVVALIIPGATTVIPPAGVSFSTTSPPVLTLSTPVDNTTTARAGVPRITSSTGTPLTVESSYGALDVSISGANSFSLSTAATVNIPVNRALSNPVPVYSVKYNGLTQLLYGTYSVDADGNKIVTVSTSDFCWFIVDPRITNATGSTGGTSGSQF